MTVRELISALAEFPPDAVAWGYDDESVVISTPDRKHDIGYIADDRGTVVVKHNGGRSK